MKERGNIFRRGNILFLNQLVKTLEEAEAKFEMYYEKKDYINVNKLKKFILQIQKKISEVIG
jgi:hypothetical protein